MYPQCPNPNQYQNEYLTQKDKKMNKFICITQVLSEVKEVKTYIRSSAIKVIIPYEGTVCKGAKSMLILLKNSKDAWVFNSKETPEEIVMLLDRQDHL